MDRFSAHLDRSWDLISRGQMTPALVAARQALDIDAQSPEVHNLLGYIHALQGDLEEALECYRQAIELDEWYLEPLLNAAEILAHPSSDPAEAIRLCRQAAELDLSPEELADTVLIEVDALLNLGRAEAARERLGAIDTAETLPVVYQVALARAYFDAGDPAAARPFADRAVEIDPDLPDAWYTCGMLAREEGRRVAAVQSFLEVRNRDLALPPPPWSRSTGEVEELVREMISGLDPEIRDQLSGAEIRVVDYPSEDQIRSEIDPRQVVLAERVDVERASFEILWVFALNLERVSGPIPPEDELRAFIVADLSVVGRERRDV
jgi:tetratricopeptide (TPR) repeat protein